MRRTRRNYPRVVLTLALVVGLLIGAGGTYVIVRNSNQTTAIASTSIMTTTVANTTLTSTFYFVTASTSTSYVHAGLDGCSISLRTCSILVYDEYPFGNVTIAKPDCLQLDFLIESTGPFTCVSSPSSELTYGTFATVNATLDQDSWNDGCLASCTPKVGTQITGSVGVIIGSGNNPAYIPFTGAFTS